MEKKGIGLIGCGLRIMSVYSTLLAATERVEVKAICDPSEASREKACEALGYRPKIYCDYNDLVSDPDVEWVLIGSWNCFHREHAVAAFEAGKHVFCEKPLATNLEDCIAMRDAASISGKHFTIGFTLRFSPHYIRLKELVQEGRIGKVISMEFNETLDFNHGGFIHADWRRKTEWAGTHLLEKCCHDIDIANWLVDSRASRVASFGGLNYFIPENVDEINRIGKNDEGQDAFRTKPVTEATAPNAFTADKDIIDNQVAIIEYENQARATFHTNCCAGIKERRLYICGDKGAIRADVIKGNIELQRFGFDTECEDISTDASGGHGGGDCILGKCLAESILEGAPSRSTMEDGLASAITCFGIDEAMNTGRVVDMAPYWNKVEASNCTLTF